MNMQIPPRAGRQWRSRGRKPPRARPRAARSILQALDEVRALLTDRPRRRDLLIEHLHLIQDHYGHLSAAHLAALAAEMKMAHDRSLRGRDLLRAFRCGEGRRDAAAGSHRARVRFAVLRDGAARRSCSTILPASSDRDVRVVRAPCMGACDHAPVVRRRPCADIQGDAATRSPLPVTANRMRMRWQPRRRFRRLSEGRRLSRC